MPFQDGLTKIVYSVSPFTIRTLDSTELTVIDPNPECHGYHGSSNGLRYRDGWLFLVHTTQNCRVIHRFIYMSSEYKIRVSTPFTFFRDSHIEFVSSLSFYDGKFWIGIGVNDERSYLISFRESEGFPEDWMNERKRPVVFQRTMGLTITPSSGEKVGQSVDFTVVKNQNSSFSEDV